MKQIRRQFATWEECLGLREVASLTKLKHDNIVRLRELVHEGGLLWFVFEFVPSNLFIRLTSKKVVFDEARIRHIMYALLISFSSKPVKAGCSPHLTTLPVPHPLMVHPLRCRRRQLLEGLHYMHKRGFFHRDLKPESAPHVCMLHVFVERVLCVRGGFTRVSACACSDLLCDGDTIKIADFGLARETRSRPPYTEYVSTRWYVLGALHVLVGLSCTTSLVCCVDNDAMANLAENVVVGRCCLD